MSRQDMIPGPPIAPGDLDYYEERIGQNELMIQAFDQNQQVGHGLQDRQGSHELAQAYAAAVSLAARLQPSQLNIVDEIAGDTEMPDLPEVLDLHQPLPHRNTIPCSQDFDPGSLVLVPSQDPFAGLPILHLDKNTILDFLQAPQPDRPSGQRYLDAAPQSSSSHSAPYNAPSSQALPFCLENYSYSSLPLSVQTVSSSQQSGTNQNYPINHKQMLAQKYAAEELQNSAFSHMVHAGMDANDSSAAFHQMYLGPDPLQQLSKEDNPADLLEGTIVGVDLSLSKSHANTSLCPQNRIPSQIVTSHQDFTIVSRPPKKDRLQRSPPKEACTVFCDDCGFYYDKECPMHRLILIEDQTVQPRAFASLPSSHLSIQNLSANSSQPLFSVFTKKLIPNRTVFGPMEGVRVQITHKPNIPFPIFISEDKDGCVLLDTKDDDRSNWMRFVRYAASPVEQNLALAQQGSQIYFKSIVQIEPKTELKVWYSDAYAQRYRLWLPQEFYVCFDCDLQFPSTDMLLQHIMSEHNDASGLQEVSSVRKPKMHRYPSGGQWSDTPISRQHSPQHLMSITPLPSPSPGELSNVYCEALSMESQVQRKGKRALNPPRPCNQELLPYNVDKSMDPVEMIEHITQAIGVDCSGNLATDMIPSNYLAMQTSHLPQLKEPEPFFNDRLEYPGVEETRDVVEKRPEVPIIAEVPPSEDFDDTLHHTCKKKKTDATVRDRQKNEQQDAMPHHLQAEEIAEEFKAVPSKISKFYQRHNEEFSRSPETSSQSDSSSSYRSDESSSSTSDSSRSSGFSEEPPPPKRLIKNIKNKHYVRADSNIAEIDSPLPSEESADICDELVITETQAERPPSPKATFMTPLKKKLPKLIPEEYQAQEVQGSKSMQPEVQSAEVSSAGGGSVGLMTPEEEPDELRKEEKRVFPCLLCKAQFHCVIILKRHSEQHKTPEGFKCTSCPRVIKDYMMIRRHIKLYHIYPATKSFRCDVCGKTFCHTDKFQRHMRVHESGDKKFKCQQCGKILSRKDKLANHMKNVHFADKKLEQQPEGQKIVDSSSKASPDSTQPTFPISQEGVSNSNNNNSNSKCRLKKEGTGVVKESLQCDKCQKTFHKRGILAQHYANKHPEIPLENTSLNDVFDKVISEFPCPYCDKSYKSNAKRKKHILQKHPDHEVPHSYKTMAASVKSSYVKCPWCPNQYTVRCKLYSHQRNKHREILEVLNLTGITEETWEKKVPVLKKAEYMEIQAKLEAELLVRKDAQEAAKLSQRQSLSEKRSIKNQSP